MHGDYKSKFDEILEKHSSFSIHHKNIQTLAIKIFKFLNGPSTQIMNEAFQVKSPASYYLSYENELYRKNSKTVTYGTESVSFKAPKWIWKPFWAWAFFEFSWEVDVNWLFMIIKSYVKVNCKDKIIIIMFVLFRPPFCDPSLYQTRSVFLRKSV